MEDQPVVEAVAGELGEVLDRLRSLVGEELDLNRSFAGVKRRFGHAWTVISQRGRGTRRCQALRHGRVREEPEIGDPGRGRVGQVGLGQPAEGRFERAEIVRSARPRSGRRRTPTGGRGRPGTGAPTIPRSDPTSSTKRSDARVAWAGRVDRVQHRLRGEQCPEREHDGHHASHRERRSERDVPVAAVAELVCDHGQDLGRARPARQRVVEDDPARGAETGDVRVQLRRALAGVGDEHLPNRDGRIVCQLEHRVPQARVLERPELVEDRLEHDGRDEAEQEHDEGSRRRRQRAARRTGTPARSRPVRRARRRSAPSRSRRPSAGRARSRARSGARSRTHARAGGRARC